MSYFLLLAVNGLVIGLIYALTAAGRKQLDVEKDSWQRLSAAVRLIFGEGDGR